MWLKAFSSGGQRVLRLMRDVASPLRRRPQKLWSICRGMGTKFRATDREWRAWYGQVLDGAFTVARPGDTIIVEMPVGLERFQANLKDALGIAAVKRQIFFVVLMSGVRVIDVTRSKASVK